MQFFFVFKKNINTIGLAQDLKLAFLKNVALQTPF
jgi:hypothetical protein